MLRIKTGSNAHKYRWVDRDDCPVDDQLNDFVIGLVTEALDQQRARAARADHERRAAEAEKRRWEEAERVRDLERGVDAWIKNQRIRAYIDEVENVGRRDGGIEAGSELEKWLRWARAHADRTDPISGGIEQADEGEKRV